MMTQVLQNHHIFPMYHKFSLSNISKQRSRSRGEVAIGNKMSWLQELQAKRCQSKVLLLICKAHNETLFSRLSLNIIREVCAYLDDLQCLVTLNEEAVNFYSFSPDQHLTKHLKETTHGGKSYCPVGNWKLLIVGGGNSTNATTKLDLESLELTPMRKMAQGRSWPGVICHRNSVWAFGGNTGNMLHTVEEFPLQSEVWQSVAPMRHARVYFTPCIWKNEIYLASVSPNQATPVEVFSPLTQLYRELPLILKDEYYGSVAYIAEGQLLFLTYSKKLRKWNLNSQSSQLEESGVVVRINLSALSNCPVQRFGQVLAWPNCNGQLTTLDLRSFSLQETK